MATYEQPPETQEVQHLVRRQGYHSVVTMACPRDVKETPC